MQSCLTLLRSYYNVNRNKIESYVNSHKAVTNPDTKYSGKEYSNILISKIQADSLIKCEKGVSDEQIVALQKFKDKFEKFDSSKPGYKELVEIDLQSYDIKTESDKGYSVQLTNAENAMLAQIEDISETMNKEQQQQNYKNSKGAVNLFFFDVSKMSSGQQALYMVLIYIAIATAAYWFYTILVKNKEDEEAHKQALKDAKKAKREAKKN